MKHPELALLVAPFGGGARRMPPTVSLMVVSQYFDTNDARSDFNLPPGEHTLSFTAVVDRQDARLFASPHLREAAAAGNE